MQTAATQTQQSLTAILIALFAALAPFLESLEAEAIRTGRPLPPSIHRLARTVAALRAIARFFGKSIPTTPAAARAERTPSTPSIHPQTPNPHQAPKPSRASFTPEPTRTLEL